MNKYLKDVESQLQAIYALTQDDDEFAENDQREVDKDELMLRSLIALSALREYLQTEASAVKSLTKVDEILEEMLNEYILP